MLFQELSQDSWLSKAQLSYCRDVDARDYNDSWHKAVKFYVSTPSQGICLSR
jgi:hypothetical protein